MLSDDARTQLRGLLDRHRPADDAEARDLERIRAFVDEHDDPWDRALAPGHLTGAAFVIDGDGRLLLTHHRKLDLWLQLGGHAEEERRASEVALREAREESGLTDLAFHPALRDVELGPLLLDVDVHGIPARGAEPAHDHLDLRFLLVTGSPEAIELQVEESHDLAWVDLDEARRRCDAGIRRAADKIAALTKPVTTAPLPSSHATASSEESKDR